MLKLLVELRRNVLNRGQQTFLSFFAGGKKPAYREKQKQEWHRVNRSQVARPANHKKRADNQRPNDKLKGSRPNGCPTCSDDRTPLLFFFFVAQTGGR